MKSSLYRTRRNRARFVFICHLRRKDEQFYCFPHDFHKISNDEIAACLSGLVLNIAEIYETGRPFCAGN